MKNSAQFKRRARAYILAGLSILLIGIPKAIFAQNTTVLPGNGVFSSQTAPQGGAKYQRQLYLITAGEVSKSGLKNGDAVTSIGFNIGAKQDTVTKGKFKVYLQNTTDTKSRMDTSWSTITVSTNSFSATGLLPGNYEWQVKANCATSSNFSSSAFFSNNSKQCYAPTNLSTSNITTTAATFRWIKPASTVTQYVVEYSRTDSISWTTATTTDTFFNASGLLPGKYYQWKVKTTCSSDKSEVAATVFVTAKTNVCNPPSALSTGRITDSSAVVQWTAASGATRQEIEYRRVGTTTWQTAISITFPDTIRGLAAGTDYEWRVRTVCGIDSVGAYVSGANFTTTGTKACYSPSNLIASNLTDSTATFTWTASQGATSYQLRYRIKETISWTNAINAMSLVHNDSITIPEVAGSYKTSFKNGASFSYTGGGVYVAYEYENRLGKISSFNNNVSTNENSFIKGVNGNDSLSLVLSLGAFGRDTLPTTLFAYNLRPETSFGSSTLKDEAEVLAIYTTGNHTLSYSSPTTIKAVIKNHTAASKTFSVLLTVKDKNNVSKFSNTKSLQVKASADTIVTFDDWSPTLTGVDSVIVSIVPASSENVVNNNRKFYLQNVNNTIQSYDDATEAMASAGLDTAAGLILSKYTMKGCASINSAKVFLSSTAEGKSVYAVVLNAAGSVVATSSALTPDSSQVNKYQQFYFTSPPAISNADYYIGLARTASSQGYAPVGVQLETPLRSGAFYKAKLDGTNLAEGAFAGRLMIQAEIVASASAPVIAGNLNLCPGSSTTLKAGIATSRFANGVVAVSSQSTEFEYGAVQALGSPNVYPNYGISSSAWQSKTADGQREFLVLSFPNPSPVNFVDIYETFNPGAVDTVFVKNPTTNTYQAVYSGTAGKTGDAAKITRINFPLTTFNVSEIRLALNSGAVSGFNAIDAVAIGKLDTTSTLTGYTFAWSTGASTSSINVTTAGQYRVTVNDGNNCSSSVSATVVAPDQTAPTITTVGTTILCRGKTIKLKSSKVGGNLWSTGETTDSIIVSTAGSYSVSYNNGSGCGTVTSSPVSVTMDTVNTVSITGTLGICPGGITQLDAGSGYSSTMWSNGATTQTITVSTPGTYSVYVTNSNGCNFSGRVSVQTVAAPSPSIVGNLSFCPGGNTTLQTGSEHSSYLWSTGATSRSIVVSDSATYSVEVTNSFGCKASTQVVTSVNTPPSPVIAGNLSLCGGPTTLNAGGGYSAYLWSTGSTSQTISPQEAGTYSVTVTDSKGCTGTASAVTSKDSLPPTPGAITGESGLLCNTTGKTFSVSPVANTSRYVWTLPAGATFSGGQDTTSNSVRINFASSFTTGYLTVAASNTCGQSGSLKPSVILVNGTPSVPGTISGIASGICGPTTKAYSIASVVSATTYMWTAPAGATITSGQGTTSITVSFSASFNGGDLCVAARNNCGTSPTQCLSLINTPLTPARIMGSSAVCRQEANVRYSVAPVEGALSYNWQVAAPAKIITGQGTNEITVNYGTSGTVVSVNTINSCGTSPMQNLTVDMLSCTGSAASITQNNKPLDLQRLKPEVVSNGGGIDKQGITSLEWTLGEPAIEPGLTKDKLFTQGFHQPTIVLSKTTTQTVVDSKEGLKVIAAPNPVTTVLKVSVDGLKGTELFVQVRDIYNRVIMAKTTISPSSNIEFNMSNLAADVYFLVITNRMGTILSTIKIVKAQ